MQNTEEIWLNKFISESGFCSRREADKYIEQGVVFVNNRRAKIGDLLKKGDKVRVNGHELEPLTEENIIFIALNKPVGITSTTEKNVKENIVKFVNHTARLFPIGRLDKDSQGLIFLTNDGDMVNKILRAGNRHEKEYIVTVDKLITPEFIKGMANGVPIMGAKTKKCSVTQETPTIFRITLVQGLNRQIRRMCEFFGYEVVKLDRIRIMNVTTRGLPVGEWRDLTDEEMEEIYLVTKDSSSEPIDTPPKGGKRFEKPSFPSKKASSNRTDDKNEVRANPDKRKPISRTGTFKKTEKPISDSPRKSEKPATGGQKRSEKPTSDGPRKSGNPTYGGGKKSVKPASGKREGKSRVKPAASSYGSKGKSSYSNYRSKASGTSGGNRKTGGGSKRGK